ncbi:MAG: ATP-binding protein [Vicinamibacteria bacterium]
MIPRQLTGDVSSSLAQFPVVALLGARQVGKTTLARAIAAKRRDCLMLDLERPSDLNKLADPELFLSEHANKLVILDEVQRKPELFPVLRSLVDEHRVPGRFLILGSAAPELLRQSSESLAGRIRYLELGPLLLSEIEDPAAAWRAHWLRGGYPGSFLAKNLEQSSQWRHSFIKTYLERDVPSFGIRVPAVTLRRFWQMVAHSHGQLWNASRLAVSLQVSPTATTHYLDILEQTFMVRRLPPFFANLKKRLVKSPKVYLRDSGLLHSLLGLEDLETLQSHPVAGTSWEGWALEQVLAAVPHTWRPSFYRTATGAEIDLVLERPGKAGPLAVEFKYSVAPQVERGFWTGLEDIKATSAFVVAPVKDSYPLKPNVWVIPVHALQRLTA